MLFLSLVIFTANLSLAQSISVMSYNIRLDTEADSLNKWANRSESVTALIKKYNPDLLGVQEALHNQMMDLQTHLPDYSFLGVGREDGIEKGEYSAIFYKKDKFEVLRQSTFWLSETIDVPGSKSWDAAITRVVTWAVLKDKLSEKTFTYANTHFDHVGKEARKNSAILIKGYMTGLFAGMGIDIPLIVSGDFNSEPTEAPYQTMISKHEIVLFDSRPASELTGTYCGFEVDKMKCRTIDYIFHSKHWKTESYKVVQDNDGKYYPSDHLPVFSTFMLK